MNPISKISPETKIAQDFTVNDWIELRSDLINRNTTERQWQRAFDIFDTRVKTRFLEPIEKILSGNEKIGEGFAATALLCVLIEFLQAFHDGLIYSQPYSPEKVKQLSEKCGKEEDEINNHCQPNEYRASAKLFRSFLSEQESFKDSFTSSLANEFFNEIRCGLLHEAATKGKSLIRAEKQDDPKCLVEKKNGSLTFYRSSFLRDLRDYLNSYKTKVISNSNLQANFIRKMDDICQIGRLFYFAYGSNMNIMQLKERVGSVHNYFNGFIRNYRYVYNKKSKDDSAKANINACNDVKVYGVCFEIDESGFRKLQKYEKGYDQCEVCVTNQNQHKGFIIAKTFISNSHTDSLPTKSYVDLIVEAAKKHNLPNDYINEYLRIQTIKSEQGAPPDRYSASAP